MARKIEVRRTRIRSIKTVAKGASWCVVVCFICISLALKKSPFSIESVLLYLIALIWISVFCVVAYQIKRDLPLLIISNEGISFSPPPFSQDIFLVPWNLVHNIEPGVIHVKYYRFAVTDDILALVVTFSYPGTNMSPPVVTKIDVMDCNYSPNEIISIIQSYMVDKK